jgi:hypothetical protein
VIEINSVAVLMNAGKHRPTSFYPFLSKTRTELCCTSQFRRLDANESIQHLFETELAMAEMS